MKYRYDLPPMPVNIKRLRVANSIPVPFFVAWVHGKPDFRLVDPIKLGACVSRKLCWICGIPLEGEANTFISGPMLAITRTSSEPPSHKECAVFAVKACPFLATPGKQYRVSNMPEGVHDTPGQMVKHNPGVALVWMSKFYAIPMEKGFLFHVLDPIEAMAYREGREATKDEIREAMEISFPLAQKAAQEQGATLKDLSDIVVKKRLAYKILGV